MPGWTREQLEDIVTNKKKNFRGLNLHGADFSGLDLEKADFRSAKAPYAHFDNCNCKFLNGEGANFMFTTWNNANCHRINLKDAKLSNADMTGVTDFFGATLTMDCNTWKDLKLSPGWWYGFQFYGLLMQPPSEEAKCKLLELLGNERYTVLREQYARRLL